MRVIQLQIIKSINFIIIFKRYSKQIMVLHSKLIVLFFLFTFK